MKNVKVLFLVVAFVAVSGMVYAQTDDPYKVFNGYLAMAKKGVAYDGAPLKGKVVGFANALGVLPFCALVEKGIKKQLALAGLDLNNGLISMDNQYNPTIALQNADVMLSMRPDIFIEYQLDATTLWPLSSAKQRYRSLQLISPFPEPISVVQTTMP